MAVVTAAVPAAAPLAATLTAGLTLLSSSAMANFSDGR